MIAKTDFQYGSARDLVEYIKQDKDRRVPVKDHTGKELAQTELKTFVDASERYGVERHMIIAPDPDAGFDAEEVDQQVRTVMNDWRSDRMGPRYVYAVHGHEDTPHAHVAITGRESAVHMDKQDVVEFRERARDAFGERERLPEREEQSEPQAEPSGRTGVLENLLEDSEPEPSPGTEADLERSGSKNEAVQQRPESGGPEALESAIVEATRAAAEELADDDHPDTEERPESEQASAETASDSDGAEPDREPEPDPEPERDYW